MFIEKIDEQLLDDIQEELDQEFSNIIDNWEDEFVDLGYEDFEDMLRSEIFEHYHHIPFYQLENLININFPFIKEKDISIEPYSNIVINKNEDDDGFKEVVINVFADVYPDEKEKLTEIECKLLDKLLEELTRLLNEILEIENTLFIRHMPIENVPKEYYHPEDINEEHNFVQIEFFI